jgi:hypothetical protein
MEYSQLGWCCRDDGGKIGETRILDSFKIMSLSVKDNAKGFS